MPRDRAWPWVHAGAVTNNVPRRTFVFSIRPLGIRYLCRRVSSFLAVHRLWPHGYCHEVRCRSVLYGRPACGGARVLYRSRRTAVRGRWRFRFSLHLRKRPDHRVTTTTIRFVFHPRRRSRVGRPGGDVGGAVRNREIHNRLRLDARRVSLRTGATLHIPVAALPAATCNRPVPLGAIFFLYRDKPGGTTLQRIDAGEAATRLYANALNNLAHGGQGLDAAIRLTSRLPCFRLQ